MEGPAKYRGAQYELLWFHFEDPGTLTQKVNFKSESLLKLEGPSEPAWLRSSFYRWGPEAPKGKDLFSVMVIEEEPGCGFLVSQALCLL